MTTLRSISLGALMAALCFPAQGQVEAEAPPATRPEARLSGPGSLSELQERIARAFIHASPLADPGDRQARDRASLKLGECQEFLQAVGDRLLWGGCEPVKGYDPRTYSLTEFDPLVWLKLYASTLMFTGEHEVKSAGPFSVLELGARFRSGLDPGEYPYPFWHSAKKWQAYVDLTSLCVVFREDRIVAVYRVATPNPSRPPADRPWDGRWQWTDAGGAQQPRVALFSYLFSAENPHRASVEQAYRKLEARFREHECTSCHAPDNQGKAKALLLLNYPNQSLIARHTLLRTLLHNDMPPENTATQLPAGITDDTGRKELIDLATAFVDQADAAVAFEASRTKDNGKVTGR